MRGNIITMNLERGAFNKPSAPLYQYDYGQVLQFTGVELPEAYEVHFSNSDKGISKTSIGSSEGVSIPDEYLQSGKDIHVWLYLHNGVEDGETEYHGIIPVMHRAEPSYYDPTPVQHDTITEAIAALNDAVEEAQGIAEALPGTISDALTEAKESGMFDGPKGDPGDPGFSPSIAVEEITNGHRVTVTNQTGHENFDVTNGAKGATGTTFTPSVSSAGVLSWTNDGGKTNPDPVNIKGDPGSGADIHICTSDEYDPFTRVPTVSDPQEDTFYLVPAEDGTSPDLFVEWIYAEDAWELFGSAKADVSNKADKVDSATSGNFAGLDSNGNLTDSGHKHSDYLTSHQDISGKADKVDSATEGNFAGLDGNGNLVDSGSKASDFLTSHQDISGKADKVESATSGNFAGLDGNGNLTDSGKKASDFATASDLALKANIANPEFTGAVSKGRTSGSTTGVESVALGYDVEASGQMSFVANGYNTASGQNSFATGFHTEASGGHSFAENYYAKASGTASHAGGVNTTASGQASSAEGSCTTANHKSQKAFGEFNVPDDSTASSTARGNYVEIVGNGTGSSAKSNARALDWNGNEYLKGDLYVGCDSSSANGSKVAKLSDIPTVHNVPSGGTSGQVLAKASGTDYDLEWADQTGGGSEIDDTAGSGDTDKAWSADKLTTEFGDKADKVASATNGNFAGLDSNGNLVDSGHKHSDYYTSAAIAIQDTQPSSADNEIWLMETAPSSVQVPTYAEHTALASAVSALPTDVQVNGTSVVTNGVANVPIASTSGVGVVKISGYGLYVSPSTGLVSINKGTETNIKAGTSDYAPVVASNQHQATFYGLAKAAGADMSSSSNAVGTYTSAAKAAIQAMLGIESCVALIETVSGSTPSITGQPNVRYNCGEVSTISITPPASGTIDVYFTSGSTAAVLTVPNTVKFPSWFDATSLDANTIYEIMITDGVYGGVTTWAT